MNTSRIGWMTIIALSAVTSLMPPGIARADLAVGDTPEFRLRTLDKETIDPGTLSGRVTVIDFWATWCGPCIAAMPEMKRLHETHASKGVVFVGISLDRAQAPLDAYLKKEELPWPQVLSKDQNDRLEQAWKVTGIPHTVILSPEGKVLWRGHPAGGLAKALADALLKHPPKLNPNEQREAAMEALNRVNTAAEEKDYAAALKAMEDVPEPMLNDRMILNKAGAALRRMVEKLEPKGASAELIKRALEDNKEGADRLKKLTAALAASNAGRSVTKSGATTREGGAATQPRSAGGATSTGEGVAISGGGGGGAEAGSQARTRLEQADKLREKGQHVSAYRIYKTITERWGSTPAGELAQQQLTKYQADAAVMKSLAQEDAISEAKQLLTLGHGYAQAGKMDFAKEKYNEVVRRFAQTPQAEEAAAALTTLK